MDVPLACLSWPVEAYSLLELNCSGTSSVLSAGAASVLQSAVAHHRRFAAAPRNLVMPGKP